MEYIVFLLLGLGAGALYASLGLGLVLSYRSSGVVNFAYGAVAVYVTYTFALLSSDGDLLNPIMGLDPRIHIADHLSLPVCLLISTAVAAILGLLLYGLVFRPLRNALPVAKLVASVGVMLVLQALVSLRIGTDPVSVGPIFPNEGVHLGGSDVPRDRLYLFGLVVVVTALLTLLYSRTRFGKLSRAAATSEKGAVLLGFSPARLAAANWIIGAVLAGLSGILLAPIVALNPATYTLFIIPALAAALIGRFSSFWVTAAAGLCIGMLQSEAAKFQSTYAWFPRTGVATALPFVIIIVVLTVRSRSIPERGTLVVRSLPVARSPRHVLVFGTLLTAAASAGLLGFGGPYKQALITTMIGVLLCLSLVLLTGWVGQLSFAHLAFAGFAGFALSKLTVDAHIPFPLAPIIAALIAGVFGFIVGLPAIRVRGVSLAVVTIGFAVAVQDFVFQNSQFTGGFAGSHVEIPSLFGVDFGTGTGTSPRPLFGFVVLTFVVIIVVCVVAIRRSSFGRDMLAVRVNEKAALSSGVNVTRTKLFSFVLSAFIAGIAGALMAYQQVQLSFASFDIFIAITIFALIYLIGITSVAGAIVAGVMIPGGVVMTFLDRSINFGKWVGIVTGIGLVFSVIRHPEGAVGGLQATWERRREGRRSVGRVPGGSTDRVEVLSAGVAAHAARTEP